ncbi:MAG: class II aldolase/adducin family protein, partial [Mycobacteriales bacterium]
MTMERSCQAQLLAMAAGPRVFITPENAALTYTQVGSEIAGWFQAQPLFDRILAEQPDCLD